MPPRAAEAAVENLKATPGFASSLCRLCLDAAQPLDSVRTRMQVGAVEASAGIVDTLRLVLAEGGQAALWRGALARARWRAPGCGSTITVFEAVDRFVGGGK